MSAMEIGKKLIEYCQANENRKAIEELYADDAVSIEAMAMDPEKGRETKGKDAILAACDWFNENMEVHDGGMEGPYPCDDEFIVPMWIDLTPKTGGMAGNRMKMSEAARYKVRDGKIVEARYYYDVEGC
ncbi:MAG: nuclear transport factor 2 family protein [Planctomycetota bacterium]